MSLTSFFTCQAVSLSQGVEPRAFVDVIHSWIGVEKHWSVALHAASCPLWYHTCNITAMRKGRRTPLMLILMQWLPITLKQQSNSCGLGGGRISSRASLYQEPSCTPLRCVFLVINIQLQTMWQVLSRITHSAGDSTFEVQCIHNANPPSPARSLSVPATTSSSALRVQDFVSTYLEN